MSPSLRLETPSCWIELEPVGIGFERHADHAASPDGVNTLPRDVPFVSGPTSFCSWVPILRPASCQQIGGGRGGWVAESSSSPNTTSRLNPRSDGAADGAAFAATGRKFTGNCHYCSRPGHMQKDCRKKKADEN